MPADADLYGIRKPKTNNKEISSSTTLAFTSHLSSLLASNKPKPATSSGRARLASKSDIFTLHNKNTRKRAIRDLEDSHNGSAQTGQQDLRGVDSDLLHRSKRKMEEKARLYSAMKRGDYVPGPKEPEALIDFDRKWAENEARGGAGNSFDTSSDDGADSEDDVPEQTVQYEDEYGRTRRGTKADAEKMERKKRNMLLGAEELERMSARPKMPSQLIYGDTIQSLAFNPDEPTATAMASLASKRDASTTPPPELHYDADKEIRSKGVGFYSFSKDEASRKKEMIALERERLETEQVRKEKEERKERRKKAIEERRKEIGEKRARKLADSFLDGLDVDLGSKVDDGGGHNT